MPVWVGMRNWHPFLHETLAEMKDPASRRALGIILSSLQTEASWARYMDDVAAAREKVGADAPEVVFAPPWGEHPRFVDAMADRTRAALAAGRARAPGRRAPRLHRAQRAGGHGGGLAVCGAARGGGAGDRGAARPRGLSRSPTRAGAGRPRDPWLEPDVADVIRALGREGARDVVVVPVGFVCDHVEVLYDLDVEARRAAARSAASTSRS